MNFVVPDFYPAAAEIFVAVMALVVMLASTFARSIARNLAYLLTQATLIVAAFITIFTMEGEVVLTFSNLFISDLLGDVLKLMIYFPPRSRCCTGVATLPTARSTSPSTTCSRC